MVVSMLARGLFRFNPKSLRIVGFPLFEPYFKGRTYSKGHVHTTKMRDPRPTAARGLLDAATSTQHCREGQLKCSRTSQRRRNRKEATNKRGSHRFRRGLLLPRHLRPCFCGVGRGAIPRRNQRRNRGGRRIVEPRAFGSIEPSLQKTADLPTSLLIDQHRTAAQSLSPFKMAPKPKCLRGK